MENPVVNCAAYCAGVRVNHVDIDNIGAVLQEPDKFVWIGLHEPEKELLDKMQKEFGLHDLAIEDAHRAHQRPKIEAYGDTLFIVLRTVQVHDKKIELGETHFFVGKNFISLSNYNNAGNLNKLSSKGSCIRNANINGVVSVFLSI